MRMIIAVFRHDEVVATRRPKAVLCKRRPREVLRRREWETGSAANASDSEPKSFVSIGQAVLPFGVAALLVSGHPQRG
jgi:hypothetical protein